MTGQAHELAGQAVEIACAAVAKAQASHGDQYAYDLATAYMCAYGVALRKLLGPEHASANIYALADKIATSPKGGA